MTGRIQLLAALLGLQLLLIAGFLYLDASGASQAEPDFLEFVVDDVDRLVISGDDGKVELARGEDGWNLADGTPADDDKVTEILDKLGALNAPWPVATSASSRDRFEVTADSHQRHIQMFAGDSVAAELYLGTSPGYRRVHARAAEADEVYSIDFSTFEVPLGADDWLDKDLLQAVGDLTEVARQGAWTLRKGEEGWLISGAAPTQAAADPVAADPDAAEKLVDRMATLRVTGLASADADLVEKGAFSITDDAGNYVLRIYHDEEEDDYAVESDRVSGRFAVATYIAEQIVVDEEDLQVEEEAAEEAATEEASDD